MPQGGASNGALLVPPLRVVKRQSRQLLTGGVARGAGVEEGLVRVALGHTVMADQESRS